MYSAIFIMWPGIALALGSWWALIPAAVIVIVFVIRTALEDRTLQAELPGYAEYAQHTRYRLGAGRVVIFRRRKERHEYCNAGSTRNVAAG